MQQLQSTLVNQPKTQRGQATLDRICAAAEQLLYKKGYHGTSINDITYKAKVAPGTFYIYFADKLSLYKYLLTSYSHQIRQHIAISVKDCTTRKEAEKMGLKAFLIFINEHKHIYNIIWESLYIDKTLFIKYYTDFAAYYVKHITESQLAGEMKQHDPTVVAYMLMGISNFIGLNYVMFHETKDFDQVVEQVINALEQGLF